MLTTRLAVKLLWFSFFVFSLSFALLQWCKYSHQCSDFQIQATVLLVMFSFICVYCFAMVLLLSYFASMFFSSYGGNMGEHGKKFLVIWKIVLTKEKYLAFKESFASTE